MGVNFHGGLFPPLFLGSESSVDARLWVIGLDAHSRNHVIKSYCILQGGGGQQGGRRSEDMPGLVGGGGEVAGQNWASLTPRLTSLTLPRGRHFPKHPTVSSMHPYTVCPPFLVLHLCALVPLPRGLRKCCSSSWSGITSQSGLVSAHHSSIRPSTRTAAPAREKRTDRGPGTMNSPAF